MIIILIILMKIIILKVIVIVVLKQYLMFFISIAYSIGSFLIAVEKKLPVFQDLLFCILYFIIFIFNFTDLVYIIFFLTKLNPKKRPKNKFIDLRFLKNLFCLSIYLKGCTCFIRSHYVIIIF